MPKSLGDFLHDQFKKAGQDVDEKSIKDFLLGLPPTLTIADEVATALDNNLLSVTDAKNNHPEIKKYYYQKSLKGVDKYIAAQIDELPEDLQRQILAEANTFEKLNLYINGLKELESSKSAPAGKENKSELQKTIDQLHRDLAAEKKGKEDLKKTFDGDILKYRVDSQVENLISRYKTTLDELDPSVKAATVRSLLNKELQDKDATLAFDEKDSFSLLKKDGSNYYGENHQQVNPASFVEQLLSRNKLLITTPKPGANQTATTTQQPASGGGGKDAGNPTLKSLASEARKAFEGNGAVVN